MAGNIQWFPGHMTKARRQMEENLKKVDFVIEIRDARIPESSKNPMLDELIKNKPRLVVLSKKDKADAASVQKWTEYLESQGMQVLALDQLNENFKAPLVAKAKKLCAPLIEKQKRRGIKPRALRAMVVGIPNVGKSTFINTLAKRKAAAAADRPGVTKSLQWIRLSSDLELLDTPGVLWPKFEDPEVGKKLALLGSVKDEVVNMDDLALFACESLMEHHPQAITDCYGVEIQPTAWQTLEKIAEKRGWLQQGRINEDRLVKTFVKDIRENRLGALTWEMPDEKSDSGKRD